MIHFRHTRWGSVILGLVSLTCSTLSLAAQLKPIFESGKTLLPGTTEPLYLVSIILPDAFIIHGEPFIIARSIDSSGNNIQHGLRYRNNQWEIIIDGRNGMFGGQPVATISICAGEALHLALNGLNNPKDAAVVKYDGNSLKYIIPSIKSIIGYGTEGYILELCNISKSGVIALSLLNSKFDNFYEKRENIELFYLKNNILSKIQKEYNSSFQTKKAFDYFYDYYILSEDGKRVYFVGVTKLSDSQLSDELFDYYYYENGKINKYINNDNTIYIDGVSPNEILFTYPAFIDNNNFYYVSYGQDIDNINNRFEIKNGIYKKSKNLIKKIIQSGDSIEGNTIKQIDDYVYIGNDTFVVKSNNRYFTISPYVSKIIASSHAFNDSDYSFQRMDSFDETHIYYINYYSNDNITEPELSLMRTNYLTYVTEKITNYNNFPRFNGNYRFEISDERIILYDQQKIYYCTLEELKNNNTAPIYSFFDSWLETDPDIHFVHGYEWIYAPEGYWPFVYSFNANTWLYLHGDSGYPLTAYAFGIGWIYSEADTWPQYFSFDQETWASF